MRLNNKEQLKYFNAGSKIKFVFIENNISENIEGEVVYNSPNKEQIFIKCKHGEYQYDYQELMEVLR